MRLASRLTIFKRTFLLMLAALIIAEGVGVALLLNRPPMHNAPVRLSEIARQLSGAPPMGSPQFGPPPGGPPGPPPGDSAGGRPPGREPPGRDRRAEWQMLDASSAPLAPQGATCRSPKNSPGCWRGASE